MWIIEIIDLNGRKIRKNDKNKNRCITGKGLFAPQKWKKKWTLVAFSFTAAVMAKGWVSAKQPVTAGIINKAFDYWWSDRFTEFGKRQSETFSTGKEEDNLPLDICYVFINA